MTNIDEYMHRAIIFHQDLVVLLAQRVLRGTPGRMDLKGFRDFLERMGFLAHPALKVPREKLGLLARKELRAFLDRKDHQEHQVQEVCTYYDKA